jgi:probable rRNA maturation factor
VISIQRASRATHIPSDRRIRAWARGALSRPAAVTLRFVAEAEGRRLNREFRGKDYATNVLTFFYEASKGTSLSGDVVICVPVVADAQGKGRRAHAHLLVHGLLHLQGRPRDGGEGARMEARERHARPLGFADPY